MGDLKYILTKLFLEYPTLPTSRRREEVIGDWAPCTRPGGQHMASWGYAPASHLKPVFLTVRLSNLMLASRTGLFRNSFHMGECQRVDEVPTPLCSLQEPEALCQEALADLCSGLTCQNCHTCPTRWSLTSGPATLWWAPALRIHPAGMQAGLTQVSWRGITGQLCPQGLGKDSTVPTAGCLLWVSTLEATFPACSSRHQACEVKKSVASVFPLEFQIMTSLCQAHLRENNARNKSIPIWIYLKLENCSLLWQHMCWKPMCHFSGVTDTE